MLCFDQNEYRFITWVVCNMNEMSLFNTVFEVYDACIFYLESWFS